MAKWTELNRGEQNEARRLRTQLVGLGVEVSVSQVARYLDECRDWRDGTVSIHALCDRCAWTPPATGEPTAEEIPASATASGVTAEAAWAPGPDRDPLAPVRAALAARIAAGNGLRAAMLAARDGGVSSNQVAAVVDGYISRPTVQKILGERGIADQATEALTTAGLTPVDDFEVYAVNGKTLLQLDGEGDAAYSAQRNTANAVLDALRQAGLIAWVDGIFDLSDHLAVGKPVEIHGNRP